MKIEYNADSIVVGAGPAGISAALEIARGGKKVVLIERSNYPGCKNMYGGAIYTCALKQVFQEDFNSIPYERIINSHTWSFLNDEGSFDITYKNSSSKDALAIKRFNLEKWMIEVAKKQGVNYVPNTLVKELIVENDTVIGVRTELEDYFAPVTIVADGVNSILAKKAGLRAPFKRKDVLLSAKIAIKLPKEIIEQRFNLEIDGSNGVNKQYFGHAFSDLKDYKNLFMMSFLYTFKDTIMLGAGCSLEDLSRNKLNINDVLENLKTHPEIAPLIKDGEVIEYSAHLIPETGFKKLPKLTKNGVIIAGDAAGLINSVHFEGTNFALISGKLAGETALAALSNNDFSDRSLSLYKKKLADSFILKDLYSYRNVIDNLYEIRGSLGEYYPQKIKEFFEIIVGANCISKSKQIKTFIRNFIKGRKLCTLFKDIFAFLGCIKDIFFGK